MCGNDALWSNGIISCFWGRSYDYDEAGGFICKILWEQRFVVPVTVELSFKKLVNMKADKPLPVKGIIELMVSIFPFSRCQ